MLLGRLTFNFNRETLVAVAETSFALQAMLKKSSAVAASSAAAASASAALANSAVAALASEEEVFTLGKVRIAMARAEVVLHRKAGAEMLAVAGVERMAFGVEVFTNKTLQLAGEVGAVIVSDLTTSAGIFHLFPLCFSLSFVCFSSLASYTLTLRHSSKLARVRSASLCSAAHRTAAQPNSIDSSRNSATLSCSPAS